MGVTISLSLYDIVLVNLGNASPCRQNAWPQVEEAEGSEVEGHDRLLRQVETIRFRARN